MRFLGAKLLTDYDASSVPVLMIALLFMPIFTMVGLSIGPLAQADLGRARLG